MKTSEEYVNSRGMKCPVCNGECMTGEELTVSRGYAAQEIQCDDCNSVWVDRYMLECYVDLIDNRPLPCISEIKIRFAKEGEHPTLSQISWVASVQSGDTLMGYWEWVAAKITKENKELMWPDL